jgi:tetratricopeptide (TPR) repeat protein
MYKKIALMVGIVLATSLVVVGLNRRWSRKNVAKSDVVAPLLLEGNGTATDKQIQQAELRIQREPDNADGYNLLASAYLQKARETGDFGYNARAEAALQKSLALAPEDFIGLRLQATLFLSYHRFSEALSVAQRAQAQRPDNADIYGAITDAQVELGNYPVAIEAAQKMVNLRPDTAAYSRVAYLRELHGDTEGAIQAMRIAVRAADPRSPESGAWCRVHLGLELLNNGQSAEAEREFDTALAHFPDYYLALAAKARVRTAAGDTTAALEYYQRAQERVPLPDTAAARGDLLAQLGRADEARREYELTEFIERSGANASTYSRQLALFLADHDLKLDEALAIARRERAARADIYTADVLAWCLYKKGMLAEAQTALDEAMRLGTRDARLYYHAGVIAAARGDARQSQKYLQLALRTDPTFNVLQAADARVKLADHGA